MIEKQGYRGYIASRAVNGSSVPQRVQNLVVRDYAQNKNVDFKLSAVEYIMPGCFMILEDVLNELPTLEGVIMYSLFMMPDDKKRRRDIFDRILREGCVFHAALENLSICKLEDIPRIEDILDVNAILSPAGMNG
jgi:sporadic carbohydrate cluster protein (TIGR04323 family)